jgi:hypothetical protein
MSSSLEDIAKILNVDPNLTIDQPSFPQLKEKLSCVVKGRVGSMELESETYVNAEFSNNPRDLNQEAFSDNGKALFALSLGFRSTSDGRFSRRDRFMHLQQLQQSLKYLAAEFDNDMTALTEAAYAGRRRAQVAVLHFINVSTQDDAALSDRSHQIVTVGVREVDGYLILLYRGLGYTLDYLKWVGEDLCDQDKHEKARELAVSYLRVPAERGSSVAQYVLGMLTYIVHFNTGTKADFLQSATWLYRGARQNHADAQFQLGEMFRLDLFREHDRNDYLARKYIKLAANQFHTMATIRKWQWNCCLMCGEDAAPHMCKLCRQARYCNSECSTRHWLEGGGVGGPKSGMPDFKHRHTCTRNAY